MNLLVYIVGPPGAGKTTAMRALTKGYERMPGELEGCPLIHLGHDGWAHEMLRGPLYEADDRRWRVVELGKDRDRFAGTDALSMSIQPKAVAAMGKLAEADPEKGWIVLAEGDRLANDKFLQAVEGQGWAVRMVYLATSLTECARRRAERGTSQDEAWMRGRITKSRRLAERWGAIPLDGAQPPERIAHELAREIKEWYDHP